MKLKSLLSCLAFLGSTMLSAQTITSVSLQGATPTGSNTWEVNYISGANADVEREVLIGYSNHINNKSGNGNDYFYYEQAGTSACWEVLQGGSGSNSWNTLPFCEVANGDTNALKTAGVHVTYFRYNTGKSGCGTAGTYTETLSLGWSTFSSGSCSGFKTGTTKIDVEVSVKVTNDNLYTWSEPTSGTDSSYKIAGNWTPTRTTPASTDVLVVDLAQNTNRNTTIYMDGVNDAIDQFIIYPYNNVTFKCSTTSNSGDWTIGRSTSSAGDDFRLDSLAGMRYDGGTLDIDIPSGNTAMFKSDLVTKSGTLKFSGAGEHHFRKNINTVGGTLSFDPASGTNTLYLEGTDASLSGTGGTLYIDSNMNVVIGNGSTSDYTLNRTLPIISNLSLAANTTLISNSPASSSVADLRSWTPYLQLKTSPVPNSSVQGQLLEVPSGAKITNGALFEIYNNKQRAYRAFGIPLKNGTIIPQFTDDIDITGTVTGTNANLFTTSCSWCTHSLFSWDEANSQWSPYASGNTITNIPVGTGILTFFRGARGNGLGDTTKVANEQVLDFKGDLQVGSKTVTLSNSGSGSLGGYNLIGNPFPCTIDLREVFESNNNNILPRFYIYDAIARRYNEWDSTGGGGRAPSRNGTSDFANAGNRYKTKLLAPGAAAFFVTKSSPTAVSVTFNESHKVSAVRSVTKHFSTGVQEEETTDCNTLRAQLQYQNNAGDENDGFTMEFDQIDFDHKGDRMDVSKLYAGYMGLGTHTENDWWLSIDRRGKMAEIGESRSVAIKSAYPQELINNELELTFNYCSEGLSNYQVQLVDKVAGTKTNITDGTSYAFTVSNDQEKKSDRFDLLFTGIDNSSSTADVKTKQCVVYPNPSDNGMFHIVNSDHKAIELVTLTDITGKILKIIDSNLYSKDVVSIETENLPTGLIFINIQGKDFKETHRIILK